MVSNRCAVRAAGAASLAIAWMLNPQIVSAQEAAADSASASASAFGGDIIVTARRRAESLQDVPASVLALSAETLSARGVATVQDLPAVAPGLAVAGTAAGGPTRPAYTLRGIYVGETLPTQDQAVAFYVNEFYMGRSNGTAQSLYDIENVQILNGPQGTLFGRNSTGGAILVTTKRPTDRFEGNVEIVVGNYNAREIRGAVNVPMADAANLRLAAIRVVRDGYTTNLRNGSKVDDRNHWSGRGSLLLTPSDNIENYTVVEYLRSRTNGFSNQISAVVSPGMFATLPDGSRIALSSRVASLYPSVLDEVAATKVRSKRQYYSNIDNFAFLKAFSATNSTTVNLSDDLILKNIAGYRYIRDKVANDTDGTQLPIQGGVLSSPTVVQNDGKEFSNELQLQGSAIGGRLSFILGAYYFWEKNREYQNSTVGVGTSLGAANPSVTDFYATNISRSLFSQFGFEVMDRLSLTGGVRYTWDKRTVLWNSPYRNFGLPTQACRMDPLMDNIDGVRDCMLQQSVTFKEPTYTIGLEYKPTDDIMLYVTNRRGYRAGGFNGRAADPTSALPFEPEIANDIEIGAKTSWELGTVARLIANLSVYRTKYSQIQRTIVVPSIIPPNLPISVTSNGADATIDGFEFASTVNVGRSFSLSGSWSYNNGVYDKFRLIASPTVTPADDSGYTTDIPFGVPHHHVTISATLTPIDHPEIGRVSVTPTYSYRSKGYAQNDLPIISELASYPERSLVNMVIDWANIGGSQFSGQFFVRNLLNEDYVEGTLSTLTSLGYVNQIYGEPRTYGISLRVNF